MERSAIAFELDRKEGRDLAEPVDLRGIPDNTREGKPGLVTLAAMAGHPLRGPRLRQLFEMGMDFRRAAAAAFNVDEDEIERRLLTNDPSLVDAAGHLYGLALELHEGTARVRPGGTVSRPQSFPLLGHLVTARGWVCDKRFFDLFVRRGFRPVGNPNFIRQPRAEEVGD